MQNAPVLDVASALNDWIEHRNKSIVVDEDRADSQADSKPIVVAEVVTNSLVVTCIEGSPEAIELERAIKALDKPVDQVKIAMTVKQTTDGETKTVGQPTLLTVDQMQGRVILGTKRDGVTIELTPSIVRTTGETKIIRVGKK